MIDGRSEDLSFEEPLHEPIEGIDLCRHIFAPRKQAVDRRAREVVVAHDLPDGSAGELFTKKCLRPIGDSETLLGRGRDYPSSARGYPA